MWSYGPQPLGLPRGQRPNGPSATLSERYRRRRRQTSRLTSPPWAHSKPRHRRRRCCHHHRYSPHHHLCFRRRPRYCHRRGRPSSTCPRLGSQRYRRRRRYGRRAETARSAKSNSRQPSRPSAGGSFQSFRSGPPPCGWRRLSRTAHLPDDPANTSSLHLHKEREPSTTSMSGCPGAAAPELPPSDQENWAKPAGEQAFPAKRRLTWTAGSNPSAETT